MIFSIRVIPNPFFYVHDKCALAYEGRGSVLGGKSAVFADLDLPRCRLSLAWFGLGAGVTDVHVHSVEARNRLRKLLTVSPLVYVLVLLWAPCPDLVVICGIGRS